MNPPPLPVRNMTRWDFYGVLFVHFPAEWPWEKARAELERLIRRIGETQITPVTIWMALRAEEQRIRDNWPPEMRRRELEKAIAEWQARRAVLRAKRLAEIAAEKAEQAAKADWSF